MGAVANTFNAKSMRTLRAALWLHTRPSSSFFFVFFCSSSFSKKDIEITGLYNGRGAGVKQESCWGGGVPLLVAFLPRERHLPVGGRKPRGKERERERKRRGGGAIGFGGVQSLLLVDSHARSLTYFSVLAFSLVLLPPPKKGLGFCKHGLCKHQVCRDTRRLRGEPDSEPRLFT